MAYIRRLPSGKWQATVRHPSGRKTTRTDPLRRVVADWAKDEEARAARGQWRDPRVSRVTYEQWCDRWLAARVVEPETRRSDESTLRLYLDPHWTGWPLHQITRLDVQAWVRGLERDGKGSQTVRRCYTTLTTMLGAAVLEGVIDVSPCRRIDLPATPPKAPAWLTRDQVDAIVSALHGGTQRPGGDTRRTTYPRHAMAVELMVWTGLRWGEMAGLRICDVDWIRQRIAVVGARTQTGRWKEYPKSARSRREVPVPAYVMAQLSALPRGRDESEPLFTTTRQDRPLSGSNWRTVWDAAVKAAGVPACSPHVCRHTAASWLVQDGVPLFDVQALLGHESHQTTQRYSHLAPDAHASVQASWSRRLAAHQRRMALDDEASHRD
jgi:integrase